MGYMTYRGQGNLNILVKVQFRGTELFKKRGHYFKKNGTCPVYLCLSEQVGDTIVDGFPISECNLIFLPIWFCHTQPMYRHDSQSRTYQRRYGYVVAMLCNVWLAESSRAPVLWRHDHNVDDQNMAVLGVDLPCLRKKICHRNPMLMR